MGIETCLCLALIVSYVLVIILSVKFKKNKLSKIVCVLFIEVIIWCSGMLFQKILTNTFSDKLIYFDYITYIGICSLFPTLLYLSYVYKNGDKKVPNYYLLLYVVPLICLVLLWTNDYHNLFYKSYSTNFTETEYGIVFYINTIYSYTLAFIFIVQMIKISVQKSRIFIKANCSNGYWKFNSAYN